MQDNRLLILDPEDRRVEVTSSQWAKILLFLSNCGWNPSEPLHHWLANGNTVSETDAATLAKVARVVLNETSKDPSQAYEAIAFDVSKLSEIAELAAEGSFLIQDAPGRQ